jgi:hypothetical protein
MPVKYICRSFGSTLILQAEATPTSEIHVKWVTRDMHAQWKTRDMDDQWKTRDMKTQWETRD